MRQPSRRWSHGVPIGERGPGESYRPDDVAPSLLGARQPGIATPVLDHLAFAAFDLTRTGRAELLELLRTLTGESERLMCAQHRPPDRGGPAGSLTLTIGLGAAVFDERYGLAARQPVGLTALPRFPGDALKPEACGGELCIQACADERATADHAVSALTAIGQGAIRMRWSQRASMRRWPGERPEGRPRNLLGFKDATGNPRRGKDLARHVWITGRERDWMLGGTYLVVRKVRVLLDAWNALSLAEQERVIGRHRDTGAPLGRSHEFEAMPLTDPRIPADAHARLANPRANGGLTLLRRGYSYDDGVDADGHADAGLLLLLYQRDPRRQFIPLQRRLAERDALARYTRTVGSAVFAIPPGAQGAASLGDRLLAS